MIYNGISLLFLSKPFFQSLCLQFRHTPNSYMCHLLKSCFYSSKNSSTHYFNTDIFIASEIKHRCFQTKRKRTRHIHVCADGKRILLVNANSILCLSFSYTQRCKWLRKQLRRVESPHLEPRFEIAYLILTGVDEQFWNEANIVRKWQVVLVHAMKSEAGRGCIAPLILNFENGLSPHTT